MADDKTPKLNPKQKEHYEKTQKELEQRTHPGQNDRTTRHNK